MDINVDNEDDAGSHAAAAYTATGYLDTKEATYTSTRVLGIQGYYINNNSQGGGGGDEGDGTVGKGTEIDADNANDTAGDPPGNEWGGDNNDYSGDVEADGADQSGSNPSNDFSGDVEADVSGPGAGDASDHGNW